MNRPANFNLSLATDQWKHLQETLAAFEAALARGDKPALESYLPPAGPERSELLIKLVHAELSSRFKSGAVVRVEDYLARFPELAADRARVIALISHEFELRLGANGVYSFDDYLSRFPEYRAELEALIAAAGRATTRGVQDRDIADNTGPFNRPELATDATQGRLPDLPGYEVLGELGRGGMGVVYKARQLSLKRLVAVKMILSRAHAGPEELARFRSEAEAVAKLQHPNIIQIHDIGAHEGLPYFSLEFVDGGSLAQRLAGRPQPPEQAAAEAETIARAMSHAHERGVVHRDLKPANILVQTHGTSPVGLCDLKIGDFGLAKQLEGDAFLTQTGVIMGTPAYMAPEQAAGRTHEIGPATDIYAIGAILYEMLTGRPPFRTGSTRQTLELVCTCEPTPPSRLAAKVPRDLETICLKALAKEPAQRYATALALANDLARCRAGEPILGRREGLSRRLLRRVQRNPRLVLGGVAAAVLLLLSLAVTWKFAERSRIAGLKERVRSSLDEVDGTPDQLAQVDGFVAELAASAPAEADETRMLVARRLKEYLAGQVARLAEPGQGTEENLQRLGRTVDLLRARDAEAADVLQKDIADRLQRWPDVFRLAPPFDHAINVFAANTIRIVPQGLTAQVAGVVPTHQASSGNVELRAVFAHPAWTTATELGLALNLADASGYAFLLRKQSKPAPAPRGSGLLADGEEKRPPDRAWVLQILRKGVVLREQEVPARSLPQGPLPFLAKREGNLLGCQVGDIKLLEFRDPFPLGGANPGVMGVVGIKDAPLSSLAAARQTSAAAPSPLQRGDDLFDRREYAQALAAYRQQAVAAVSEEVRQEAQYKEGLSLLAMHRDAEAAKVLEEVGSAAKGDRWPLLADAQLWVLLLSRNDEAERDRAEAVQERLIARGQGLLDEVAVLVSEDARRKIIDDANRQHRLYDFATDPAKVVAFHRRRVAIFHLLNPDGTQENYAVIDLVRAYRLADREEDAIRSATEFLRNYSALTPTDVPRRVLEQLSWAYRLRGLPDRALVELQRFLSASPPDKQQADFQTWLLPEHARVLAALNRWAEAEDLVDGAFKDPSNRNSLWHRVTCCLLKGFFRERAGDAGGAQAAWKRGVKAYRENGGPDDRGGVSPQVNYMIMASLTDDLPAEEARRLQGRLLAGVSSGGAVGPQVEAFANLVPPEAFRVMWRTPRGRQWARKMALLNLSYGDWMRVPALLMLTQALNTHSFGGAATPEQEQLIWDLVHDAYAAHLQGKSGINATTQMQLAFTYQGTTPFLWSGVKDKLDPSLRGPIAYVFGARYVRKNRPQDAAAFFRTALENAQPGTALQRLAKSELGRLEKK